MLQRILSIVLLSVFVSVHSFAVGVEVTTSTSSSSSAFPLVGPVRAEEIGNIVWWRPTLDEKAIEQMMADLQRWGYRNVMVESFWGGQTIYPSKVFPPKTNDGKDWLKIICEAGARHNIRVHAWIHTFFWGLRANVTSGSLLAQHPHWIEQTLDGQLPQSGERDYVFASPAVREVRAALGKLVDELCERDIVGINIDYIRYPFTVPDSGYNPVAVERFRNETGLDARTITKDLTPNSPWMRWVEFRERMVTETVEELSSRIRFNSARSGRRILVSAAYFPGYKKERGSNPKCQNWYVWVERGLLDLSTPMCYSPTLEGLKEELAEVREVHVGKPTACIPGLAVGRFSSPHPPYIQQLELARNAGFPAIAVFKYETLKDEIEKLK
ncbi:MAG: family 10 glycosylhydrolase [Candidatus Sumerlaea chitinivorans]|nr:family 10 glycosylhydrolase [Candidatus Sumerlaea chitinivorans]